MKLMLAIDLLISEIEQAFDGINGLRNQKEHTEEVEGELTKIHDNIKRALDAAKTL